jgi:hypothetical protein
LTIPEKILYNPHPQSVCALRHIFQPRSDRAGYKLKFAFLYSMIGVRTITQGNAIWMEDVRLSVFPCADAVETIPAYLFFMPFCHKGILKNDFLKKFRPQVKAKRAFFGSS